MTADRTISELAAGQHWVVGRRQLVEAGVAAHVLDHRIRAGLLVPVHVGVYALSGSEATWPQRITAATLATGGVASHRAAGFLHRLPGVEARAEVTAPAGRAPRPAGVLVHRVGSLPGRDVERRDGISRTRIVPTLLGLAAVVPASALEGALDDALVRGLVSLQYEVVLPGGGRAFLDFAWPEVRLAMEADSYRHHASRRDWARDHGRNAVVVALGWRVLPVTWDDLVDRPRDLIALLERARAA